MRVDIGIDDAADAGPPTVPGVAAEADEARPAAASDTNAASGSAEELPTIGHIGRYALKYRIGEGGLGMVYAAHDPLLSRLIAIKTLHVDIAPDARQTFDALFLNEARAAGGLSHPHIVTVFDAGVSEQGVYIAMELLKGRDLRQLRQEGWRPTPAQAAMIVRRVADALAYAHAKGVVHRDIKPANIFMVGRTQPRVLDFGIARIAHQHDLLGDDSITAGSPYYMAPEQLRHEPVDRRGDVYSLGVVFYELLTGHKPFTGTTLAQISEAVLNQVPLPAHLVDAQVPQVLSDIAARAMEKSPEQRYRSARSMSRELRHWLEEHAQATDESAARPMPEPGSGPSRRWWALGGASALAIALLAGWWVQQTTPARPPVAAAAGTPNAAAAAPAPLPAALATATQRAEPPAVAATLPASSAALLKTALPPSGAAPAKAAPAPHPAGTAVSTRQAKARGSKGAESRAAPAGSAAPAAAAATGIMHIAISPWGQIEVDGRDAGTSPPLNQLTLSEGVHTIVVRNADFPPHTVKLNVNASQPVNLRHRF